MTSFRDSYQNRDAWLAARRRSIGSSDAPVLYDLGYASQSRYATWSEKVYGTTTDWSKSDLRRLRVGHAMEATLRELLAESLGVSVNIDPPHSFRVHKDLPFLTASLDCFVVENGNEIPCELKNFGGHFAREFDDGACPLRVQVQLGHQLLVTDAPYGYVYCMVAGEPLDEPIRVMRDEAFDAVHLQLCQDFWRLVESKTPPDIDGSEATTNAIKSRWKRERGPRVDVSDELDTLAADIDLFSADIKAAQEKVDEYKNRIREMIGDAEGCISPSGVEFTWKTQQRSGYVVAPSESRILRRVGARKGK